MDSEHKEDAAKTRGLALFWKEDSEKLSQRSQTLEQKNTAPYKEPEFSYCIYIRGCDYKRLVLEQRLCQSDSGPGSKDRILRVRPAKLNAPEDQPPMKFPWASYPCIPEKRACKLVSQSICNFIPCDRYGSWRILRPWAATLRASPRRLTAAKRISSHKS